MNTNEVLNKLIAEIERRKKRAEHYEEISLTDGERSYWSGESGSLELLASFITSLQQEQPDKYETALEKAREWMPNVNQGGHAILIDIFPELGEGLDPRYGGRKQEQPEPSCKSCGFYENNCPYIRGQFMPYPQKVCKDYTYSVMQEQPEVEFEDKFAKFLERKDVELGANSWSEEDLYELAMYFYELGLNARKEE